MANYDYDIGIIGGGAAGLTVASGSAQLGAKTLLVEKEGQLGGDCLHFGCVPSKTLIHSARVYHLMKSAPLYGLPEIEIGPVDFSQIAARIASVIATIQHHDSQERFCSLGARVEFGRPTFVNDHEIDLDGNTVSAKTWVIATGSSAIRVPIHGLAQTPHLTNREIFSMDRLPESMLIIGAGPIGVEMAQAFARFGTRVTVIDQAGQILGKEDPDMAKMVQDVLESEGVTFLLNAVVEEVGQVSGRPQVTLMQADGTFTRLSGHALLVALGRKANVDQLGLEAAGVSYSNRGVIVDNRLRTNRKHIFAAGDVNGGYQFTHAAGYEGGIVISNAIFRLPRKADYTFLPWCTYTEPELAHIGMNETEAKKAGIPYSLWSEAFADNDRSQAEGQRIGKIKMLLDQNETPIGVQILGPHAGELISEWVAVLNGKVKLSTLAAAVHPYPTLGEINKRVAGSFFSTKIFSDKIQKGLKFFFNLKGRACFPSSEP
jgi:pyruvate/2-oxoglutarate dehydrogenase complex dihydrolipoamide dehydrogenase (E3) component